MCAHSGKSIPTALISDAVEQARSIQRDSTFSSIGDCHEVLFNFRSQNYIEKKPEKTPTQKYELYQRMKQKPVTRKRANEAKNEFEIFAGNRRRNILESETVFEFIEYLKTEKNNSDSTIEKKIAYIKTWLKQAYKVETVVKIPRREDT